MSTDCAPGYRREGQPASLCSEVPAMRALQPGLCGSHQAEPEAWGAPGEAGSAGQTHQRGLTWPLSEGGREWRLGVVPGRFQSGSQTPRAPGGGEGPRDKGVLWNEPSGVTWTPRLTFRTKPGLDMCLYTHQQKWVAAGGRPCQAAHLRRHLPRRGLPPVGNSCSRQIASEGERPHPGG